jgi:DNA-binding transcriptional ArsR family regulator
MEPSTLDSAAVGEPINAGALELPAVLAALSDPIRLRIVTRLAQDDECACSSFGLPITKSTCSHHLRVLREAGVIEQRVDGKSRLNRLRMESLETRFPGLLEAILRAQEA